MSSRPSWWPAPEASFGPCGFPVLPSKAFRRRARRLRISERISAHQHSTTLSRSFLLRAFLKLVPRDKCLNDFERQCPDGAAAPMPVDRSSRAIGAAVPLDGDPPHKEFTVKETFVVVTVPRPPSPPPVGPPGCWYLVTARQQAHEDYLACEKRPRNPPPAASRAHAEVQAGTDILILSKLTTRSKVFCTTYYGIGCVSFLQHSLARLTCVAGVRQGYTDICSSAFMICYACLAPMSSTCLDFHGFHPLSALSRTHAFWETYDAIQAAKARIPHLEDSWRVGASTEDSSCNELALTVWTEHGARLAPQVGRCSSDCFCCQVQRRPWLLAKRRRGDSQATRQYDCLPDVSQSSRFSWRVAPDFADAQPSVAEDIETFYPPPLFD